jgi:hypothetical protein
MESKLSYYIMVDLVLSPGAKMNPMEKLSMACTMKMDNILKSLNETFGYVYSPPPLFNDYDVVKHDKDGSKLSKSLDFETSYDVAQREREREREIGALITENHRLSTNQLATNQQLGTNQAMLNGTQLRQGSSWRFK